ncbi:MAG TPA: hypothetical protein DCK79_08020 [Candidatus Atribacteria bacterium]|nr:hypothetical protein [Candidatus Atribacteria bacterium]
MDKIKIFLKGNFAYFLTFLIILVFPLSAYFLFVKKELITEKAFFSNVLGFAGWIIALLIAWIHIRKNREDNLVIQNNEIRKRLEIEAFKEVNKTIEEINLALSEMGAYYGYELIKELSFNESTLFLDKLQKTYIQLNKQMEDRLLMLWIKYQLKIRSHEIVLIRFNDLKKKVDFKFKKSVLLTSGFVNYTRELKTKDTLSGNEFLEIKNKCKKIDKSFSSLGKGLTDYGLELQNEMLGEIFNSKISKPKDKEPRRTFAQIISNTCKQDK